MSGPRAPYRLRHEPQSTPLKFEEPPIELEARAIVTSGVTRQTVCQMAQPKCRAKPDWRVPRLSRLALAMVAAKAAAEGV
jgi:hypothetical protein